MQPASLYSTYLNFYAAICIESSGRLMHDLAPTKLPFLRQALESYRAAAASLPAMTGSNTDNEEEALSETSDETSRPFTPTRNAFRSRRYSSSPSSNGSFPDFDRDFNEILKPSPLRVYKHFDDENQYRKPVAADPITPPRPHPCVPQYRRTSILFKR